MRNSVLRLFAGCALLACPAAAQRTDASMRTSDSTAHTSGATVSGMVRDSIARKPLTGATVQLVPADVAAHADAHAARTVMSDSLGRYVIDDVPDGTYTIGFFHPLLDSLGVDPLLRRVRVSSHRPVRADLGTPSPARLRAAICGPRTASDSSTMGALLMGVVRESADRSPAAGVAVTGEWFEMTFLPKGIDMGRPRFVVTTGQNGWFAMCNVPSGGTMMLRAARGADTTDFIEVDVPATGFLRRELYIGPSRTEVRVDATGRTNSPRRDSAGVDSLRPDSLALAPRHVHLGDGRLRGTVTTVEGSRPLVGALVRIMDGPQARTNDRGEWTLVDAPAGTRMLEVRAIGYFPVHRGVDVITDAPPVRVSLSTFKAMLDTVKITVLRIRDRSGGGFDRRRRSTGGKFLTEEQIARLGDVWTSDLLRMTPGVRIVGDGFDRNILVRGAFGYCKPAVFIDGLYMFTLSADETDGLVTPSRLRGVEIYVEPWVPGEFQVAMSGCGAIVFWTK